MLLTLQNLVNNSDYLDISDYLVNNSDYLILKSTYCVIGSTTAYLQRLPFLSAVYIRWPVNWDYINCTMCLSGAQLLCLTLFDERGEWTFTGKGWRRQTERSLTIGHHPPPPPPPRCIIRNKIMKEQMHQSLVLNLTHLRIYSKGIFASHSRSKITHNRFLVI